MAYIMSATHPLHPRSLTLATMVMALAWLAATSSVNAETFNTGDMASHEDWQSITLSRGGEQHYRAVEATSYSDATLSLNATSGICDLPWLEMRVTLDQQQDESRTVNLVPARLRIDEQPVIDTMAEFITERGDDGFYAHFYLSDFTTLMPDLRQGEQLFLGFDQGDQEPWYMTFSLQGAGTAINRMLAQCEGADDYK